MTTVTKSFVYGICFASITWAISLLLYWQLVNNKNVNITSHPHNVAALTNNNKSRYAVSKYVGPDMLMKNIQPVHKKSNSDTVSRNDELGLIRNMEDQKIRDDGYKQHAFNVLISNRLSYHRHIPDTRNKLCRSVAYPEKLPSASIIICFYNEHFNTLIRTIHSVIDRTPSSVLEEIVLIDDYSDISNLHSDIMHYIEKNLDSRVTLYKTERREGLIRARIFGARKSKGDVIIFLDSHVEVNVNWSQPLLTRIKEDRTNVVMPVIDIINADTFAYTGSPLVRGGFNWGLHFKWENLPVGTLSKDEDFIEPIRSPTMAGGLFAIDRKYFKELGEYDAGMNIWGGENLELSFRIWMCGGSLTLIPCSRVGHIFRHRRPYGAPNGEDTMLHNSLRVAYVWMDSYKDYFLKQRPDAKKINFGDVSSRLQLRKELKCHDFDWYLKNVYPELTLPTDNEQRLKKKWAALEKDKYQPWHLRKRNYVDQYQIRLTNSTLCVQSRKDIKSKGSLLVLKPCLRTKNQMWYQTDKNELVLAQLLCLQAAKPSPYLYKCHEMGGDQEWKHKGENNTPIYNMAAGTCLAAEKKKVDAVLVLKICSNATLSMWDFIKG